MYSRSSSGSNDIWQSPLSNRRSSNFENIWSNGSSISSGAGITFDQIDHGTFQGTDQGYNLSPRQSNDTDGQGQGQIPGQGQGPQGNQLQNQPHPQSQPQHSGSFDSNGGYGMYYRTPGPFDSYEPFYDPTLTHQFNNYNLQGQGQIPAPQGAQGAPNSAPHRHSIQIGQAGVTNPSSQIGQGPVGHIQSAHQIGQTQLSNQPGQPGQPGQLSVSSQPGQPGPGWLEHRRSINSFSPTTEAPDFRFDINRRHSFGDYHYIDVNEEPKPLDMINEYFETDPHTRVKVTLKLLEENYFDDNSHNIENLQLPKFPIESSLRNYQLVLVGFKAGRIDVFYLPNNNNESIRLNIGDLVFVEADRGRDLGKIAKLNLSIDEARLLKFLHFQEQQQALNDNTDELNLQFNQNNSSPPVLHFPKPVIALAQPNEVMKVLNKKQDEEKACRLCLAKISNLNYLNSNNLNDLVNMKLIDAEYQFDRNKLIFYYVTNKRIDFRDLVRELFRIYKTRIWMCAVIGNATGQVTAQAQLGQGQQGQQQHHQPQVHQHRQPQVHQHQQGQPALVQAQFKVPFTSKETPRHLAKQEPKEEDDEKFMLKSLVDQINH